VALQTSSHTHEQSPNERKHPGSRNGNVKRYSLVLPEELFDAVQELAEQRQTTVVELIRRFIKLGLIAARIEETEGAALIIREGETEREIILL